MREDHLEAMDKMFPKGYCLLYTCPNGDFRMTHYNPHQYVLLEQKRRLMCGEYTWEVRDMGSAVHICPALDAKPHSLSNDCPCGPKVNYIDKDTDLPYTNGPLVVHNAWDGRE